LTWSWLLVNIWPPLTHSTVCAHLFSGARAAILILLAGSLALTAPSNPGGDIALQKDTSRGLIDRERVHWPGIFAGLKEVSLAECASMRTKQVPWNTAGTTGTTCRTEIVVRNVESNAYEIPQHGECKMHEIRKI
jgi:hypothetical protein